MKLKIKPYIFYLLKENFLYIIGLFFILILLFFVFFIGINKVIKSNKEIKKLEIELLDLKNQIAAFNYDDKKEKKISESIELLNMLIPDLEDYFSIIYALEKLSYKTGFMIVGYSVDVASSSKNKIKLSVSGIGDSNSFLNFLSEYNFGGGRLITSDNIEYNSQKSGVIKINLTFYNKNQKNYSLIEKNLVLENNIDDILLEIDKIKNKVSFDFTEIQEKEDFDYPKKSNPFQ